MSPWLHLLAGLFIWWAVLRACGLFSIDYTDHRAIRRRQFARRRRWMIIDDSDVYRHGRARQREWLLASSRRVKRGMPVEADYQVQDNQPPRGPLVFRADHAPRIYRIVGSELSAWQVRIWERTGRIESITYVYFRRARLAAMQVKIGVGLLGKQTAFASHQMERFARLMTNDFSNERNS